MICRTSAGEVGVMTVSFCLRLLCQFPRYDPGQRRRCLPALQFQTIGERLRFFIVRENEFAHTVNRWQWFFVGAERSRHSPNRVVLRGEGFEFSFSSIIPMRT
jgi:hypothetical protein